MFRVFNYLTAAGIALFGYPQFLTWAMANLPLTSFVSALATVCPSCAENNSVGYITLFGFVMLCLAGGQLVEHLLSVLFGFGVSNVAYGMTAMRRASAVAESKLKL